MPGELWTVEHFYDWSSQLVFEDGECHPPEDWQLEVVADLFAGFEEVWLVVPQGNSKSTLISEVGLYHLDNTRIPWVPVGAASRDQAEIIFGQAQGFVVRTPGLKWDREQNEGGPFRLYGTRQILHTYTGGRGLKVYAADSETADGVIPTLSLCDEGHRMKDLSLYRTWRGKNSKRGGQSMMISTAGEPGGDFERTRDALRDEASDREQSGPAYGRYATESTVLHEYAVPDARLVKDLKVVKAANPLSTITEAGLRRLMNSPTLDWGEDWLRLTCNIPARSSKAAVAEADWAAAATAQGIPAGEPVWVGADFAWVLDTTALVPLWIRDPGFRLLGPAVILTPPRDGTMLDVEDVHAAFQAVHARNPIKCVVMDTTKAQDTAQWIADELGCDVVDRAQTNMLATADYDAFMRGLRRNKLENPHGGWLYHSGDSGLRTHIMNAIARKLPGDRYRFDRQSPSRAAAKQDVRVIDALTAASMVVSVVDAEIGEDDGPMVAVAAR